MTYIIVYIIVGYIALLVLLTLFQRQLMYHPVMAEVTPSSYGLPHQDIVLKSEDGTLLQLWYHEAEPGQPTILYFHGNAGNLSDRVDLFAAFIRKGLGVAAVSYRGYGKSKGKPHEKGIFSDARTAIKWVKARGIPLSDMAYYGESLGTGVAVKMAVEMPPKALFLQAPYTSVSGRAAEIYWYVPVRFLIRDHFNSLAHIKQVHVPLTIFHGKLDQVIPVHHAEMLLAAANEPKQAVFFDDVGHTDFNSQTLATHVAETLDMIP